jgi:hypothetical protein
MAARFSLRAALAWMAASAVILAILALGNTWSWSAFSTLTMFLLTCAIPIALVSVGSTRAFWAGFGTAGWFFFLLAHSALEPLNLHPNMMITQHVIYEMLRSTMREDQQRGGLIRLSAVELSVLLFAVLAGFACRWAFNHQGTSQK